MIDAVSFGEWLRKRRKAMDLTQGDLGRQLGLSTASIRKMENDERRPSREMVERIARHMQIPPNEREAFAQFARMQSTQPPNEAPAAFVTTASGGASTFEPTPAEQPIWLRQRHLSTLPTPTTPLLGREEEQAAIEQLLLQPHVRLVTLTGTGGTGKTRLALVVATSLREHFRGGTLLVPLASVHDPDFVLTAIAQSLGLREAASVLDRSLLDALQDFLRPRQLLLVLDNFEQVIEAAPVVSALLAAAPRLKVLVTSRERLYLSAEHEWPVPPLELPPRTGRLGGERDTTGSPSAVEVEALAAYPAIALFVQRARAAHAGFTFDAGNADAVVEICRRLDGLPLAMELAAARSKVLSPQAILKYLRGDGASQLTVLTSRNQDLPARQQTIERMIRWSYELLREPEQRVFARLGIFANGFTLAAATAICADIPAGGRMLSADDSDAVFELLVSLVDKSLVLHQQHANDEGRWRILEIIRAFAYERLLERGEHEEIARRYAHYYLQLVEDAAPRLIGAEQGMLLSRLDVEHANLHSVLSWMLEHEREQARRVASALWLFWRQRGYWGEGRQWIERILEGEEPSASAAVPSVAILLAQAGSLAVLQHDIAYAVMVSERAIALSRGSGEDAWAQRAIGWAHANLGVVALDRGDYDTARAKLQTSLELFRQLDHTWGIATVLNNMGEVATTQGRYEQAIEWHAQSLAVLRAVGNEATAAWPNLDIGRLLIIQNRVAEGQKRLRASLAVFRSVDDRWGIAWALNHLVWALRIKGTFDEAIILLRESQRLFELLGDHWGTTSALEHAAWLRLHEGDAVAAEEMGKVALQRFRSIGNALAIFSTLELLVAVAVTRGRWQHGAQLAGAIDALRLRMGVPRLPVDEPQFARDLSQIVAAPEDTRASLATGRAWNLDSLVSAALDELAT